MHLPIALHLAAFGHPAQGLNEPTFPPALYAAGRETFFSFIFIHISVCLSPTTETTALYTSGSNTSQTVAYA